MEKISLFDLLSFAVPGAASLSLIYWSALNCTNWRLDTFSFPESLIVVAFFMMAYFVGHLINEIGMKIEKRLGPLPKSWVEILENNPDLAKNLNEISVKLFKFPFLAENGKVDVNASDLFYDYAFNILENGGKMEKIRILQSQYVYFRNTVVIGIIGTGSFLAVAFSQIFNLTSYKVELLSFSIFGVLFSVFAMYQARKLSIKRRKMKMTATLNNFYAYYISENNFKTK